MVWPVTEEEQKVGGCFGRFRHETIYRVKARALLDRTVPPGRSAAFYNQFYVTEILEANAACPILEDLLAEYQKPIVLKDDLLGELVLNKRMSAFEGGIMWSEHMISIMLDVDQDNKGSWTRARKAMGNMLKEQEKWDKEMRGFAAEKLTSLANDWQDEDDETKPEITKQDFAKRIQLRELSMTAGGSFTAYYDDDDMFLGHSVTVYGTLKSGIKTAQMEG